jgi:hypothetical protein
MECCYSNPGRATLVFVLLSIVHNYTDHLNTKEKLLKMWPYDELYLYILKRKEEREYEMTHY